ncbi:MAG TPA: ring-opening amidohydrolase [Acetobacteraceae bacterium]|nr:ring-opening amidohydrolase [Acetobacteraceae bacterium]
MPLREARLHRIGAAAPDDVSGLAAGIAAGEIRPDRIIAIFGKTEGNGLVNDFSRGFAVRALADLLARHLGPEAAAQICLVMSGGTEGGLSPHFLVFEVRDASGEADPAALAIGRARTPDLPPEALGRLAQVDQVAAGVAAAMRDAGIDDPAAVHFVQVKCPLLTAARVQEAARRGAATATRDTLKSMSLSRAAASLGIATALEETDRPALRDAAIGADWSLHSARASASAGIELAGHEIVVLGRGRGWTGPLRIDHAVMQDALDIESVRAALARLDLASPGQLPPPLRDRLVTLLAKAEAASDARLRGFRHTMLDDSDLAATRHARAFVAGALASLVGHAQIYVSGGAEHQGPDGGGPVAIIARAT